MISLQQLFIEKETTVRSYITEFVGWEHFDPDAPVCRGYLFGRQYYTPKETAKLIPEDVQTLDLTPVQTTGKYPLTWETLTDEQKINATPACDNDSLKTLKDHYPEHEVILQLIIDYKALHQVVKNFLKPPDTDEDGEETYNDGLIAKVDHDGCIRGTFLQTTETGRFRSLKPNLNNLSGNAELETRRQFALSPKFFEVEWRNLSTRELIAQGLLDPRYDILRAIVEAPPGYVILGADYSQAELFSLARISGDAVLIEAMEDPLIHLHAETAINAFGLKVPEGEGRKSWVKLHHPDLRNCAKTVIFG